MCLTHVKHMLNMCEIKHFIHVYFFYVIVKDSSILEKCKYVDSSKGIIIQDQINSNNATCYEHADVKKKMLWINDRDVYD